MLKLMGNAQKFCLSKPVLWVLIGSISLVKQFDNNLVEKSILFLIRAMLTFCFAY